MSRQTDDLDKRLVEELAKDSSQSAKTLSEKLHVTRQTIASRIERLRQDSVIAGFKAKLNYEKLGYHSFFILFLKIGNLDRALLSKALEEFRSSPNVILDASVTGEWDIVQVLAFKSAHEYDDYIATLKTRYSEVFRDSKSHVVLKFFKSPDEFAPEL